MLLRRRVASVPAWAAQYASAGVAAPGAHLAGEDDTSGIYTRHGHGSAVVVQLEAFCRPMQQGPALSQVCHPRPDDGVRAGNLASSS
jgi:hypothetical protein